MIKAVLFDLDNTLVDFLRMKRACSSAALQAMIEAGLEIDEKKAEKLLFELYEKHGWENQQIFDIFLKEVLGRIDYRILAAGVVAYRRVKAGHLIPYRNVLRTLVQLKGLGLKLGIVSDAPVKQAWLRLTELNIAEFFDVVAARSSLKAKRKPEPYIFLKALKMLKVRPGEVLYVGDDPKRDIEGASKLGMKTVLARYGQIFFDKCKADFQIKDPIELVEIVKKLNGIEK